MLSVFKILGITASDTVQTSDDDHLNVQDSWLDLWKCLWNNTTE